VAEKQQLFLPFHKVKDKTEHAISAITRQFFLKVL